MLQLHQLLAAAALLAVCLPAFGQDSAATVAVAAAARKVKSAPPADYPDRAGCGCVIAGRQPDQVCKSGTGCEAWGNEPGGCVCTAGRRGMAATPVEPRFMAVPEPMPACRQVLVRTTDARGRTVYQYQTVCPTQQPRRVPP